MESRDEYILYVSGLHEKVNQELLEELFTQIGPVEKVTLNSKPGSIRYAFVEFTDVESVLFAIETMDGIELFKQALVVKPRNRTNNEKLWEERKKTLSKQLPSTQPAEFTSPQKATTTIGGYGGPPSLPPPRQSYDRNEVQEYGRSRHSYLDEGYGMPPKGGRDRAGNQDRNARSEQRRSWDGRQSSGQRAMVGGVELRDRDMGGMGRSETWRNNRNLSYRGDGDTDYRVRGEMGGGGGLASGGFIPRNEFPRNGPMLGSPRNQDQGHSTPLRGQRQFGQFSQQQRRHY